MSLIRRFVKEDNGAETVEYALVLGLMALAAVVGIGAAGTAVNGWWNRLSTYVAGIAA